MSLLHQSVAFNLCLFFRYLGFSYYKVFFFFGIPLVLSNAYFNLSTIDKYLHVLKFTIIIIGRVYSHGAMLFAALYSSMLTILKTQFLCNLLYLLAFLHASTEK